ncbi:uncharacterized protein MELLADRAFT_96203 [Melampsora larici-populina 98AG31]|uniref:Uncharacterized protein n=1 Tax=Melampsora larici-populina (strain 98AG31 / pathotype 3-4-7) TaxID=747676 RepID=F4SBB8_MELLP|nr:uncharacterized protein MELLADRAFT_96203 [Melampsora larici-populina 98AG31]EGF98065.1 hypothetical protein MELLADRAFT_96203 [Melampsora larici-populina 98AG31]
MDDAIHQAAIRAEELRMTRSRSIATGQAPGPPLGITRRTTNRSEANKNVDPNSVSNVDPVPNEVENLDGVDMLDEAEEGPGIDAEDASWVAPPEKGKGRASSSATSSRGDVEGEMDQAYEEWNPQGARCLQEPGRGKPRGRSPGSPPNIAVDGGRGFGSDTQILPSIATRSGCTFSADPNVWVTQLFEDGRYAEGHALLEQLMNLAHPPQAPYVANADQPIPSGSGTNTAKQRRLLQEDPSSPSKGDLPLAKRPRPCGATEKAFPAGTQQSLQAMGIAQGQRLPGDRLHDQNQDCRQQSSGDLYKQGTRQDHPQPVDHPTQFNHNCFPPRRQTSPSAGRPDAAPPQRDTPANQANPELEDPDAAEAAQVKILLAAKKGRMVLHNGDVVENGRYLVADPSDEMEKGLTPLSPVLTHWLRTFKSYIPLTVFNQIFLIDDQQEWSRWKAPTEAKIDDGSASLRVYGGAPPPEELTMQFGHWIDGISLFIKYVAAEGWETLAERFEGHRRVVMDLRENFGWMIALRYCRRIRQGVMRETLDNKIKNFSTLQSDIFEEAKMTADSLNEKAYRTNPYAPDGPLSHLNPLTGLPRTNTTASTLTTRKSTYKGNKPKPKESVIAKREVDWIPSAEWKLMSSEQRRDVKRGMNLPNKRPYQGVSSGRYYREDEPYRNRDRGEERTYRRRSRSRSRSPRGNKRKKPGGGRQ